MSESEMLNNEREQNAANQDIAEQPDNADQLSALQEENRRLRDQALRAVADLENVRRRAQQERAQLIEYGNERLLRELLPVVDDFRRSVEMGGKSKDFDNFYQGVEMVNNKLAKLLDSQGVIRIDVVGQPFNVDLHEALMRQTSEAPEGTVITELEPGYMYGDKVLRHAKVIVSAGG